jgi:hypothetical protein
MHFIICDDSQTTIFQCAFTDTQEITWLDTRTNFVGQQDLKRYFLLYNCQWNIFQYLFNNSPVEVLFISWSYIISDLPRIQVMDTRQSSSSILYYNFHLLVKVSLEDFRPNRLL